MEYPLHYTLSGTNQTTTLIFLHGFLGTIHDWTRVSSRLNNYRCLSIELPGHGKSLDKDWMAPYLMSDISQSIAKIIKVEGLENNVLCGYSMGGRIAIHTTLQYPSLFKQLILESTNPGIQDPSERKERLQNDQLWAETFYNDIKSSIRKWYKQNLFDSLQLHPQFQELLIRRQKQNKLGIKQAMLSLSPGIQEPLWDKCTTIQVPTTLISGEYDIKYKTIGNKLEQTIQGAQHKIVKGAGHNSHFENPVEFINILKEVLVT